MSTERIDPPSISECDHCAQPVHRDCMGWWVDADDTPDCRRNLTGHEVNGEPR